MTQLQNMSIATNKKDFGREYPNPEEPAVITEMVHEMKDQVDRMYEKTKMLRQVHTKMHGCVKASFTIEENLPEELKVGVFKEAKEYHAWVRFSNASTKPKPDKKKDIRGIAIKLMNVPGEKILKDEHLEKTQDFLLMTHETFFSKNLMEFRKTLKAVTAKSKLPLIGYFLNPMHWGLVLRLMKSMKKSTNPLSESYWSTQPYRFGAEDKAVKYFLKPSKSNVLINEDTSDDDFLKVNLSQTLNTNSVEFDFFVQLQTNADTMPIEDPTIPWTSEFQKVATLKIIKQDFDSEQQITFGENLSFNAWHSLPEHQPLGSFNRARKIAYEALSKYRHDKNQIPMFEPEDSDNFLETTFNTL
jgi:catalase